MSINGPRAFRLVTLGRLACIPFSLLGGLCCYLWACALFGELSGFLALSLWCFCPVILGDGAFITPDVPAAALAITAAYTFARWLKEPKWGRACVAGIVLGAANLAKTTMLVFYLLWPVCAAICLLGQPETRRAVTRGSCVRRLFVMLSISVYVINAGYGFRRSFTKLGDYQFCSALARRYFPQRT